MNRLTTALTITALAVAAVAIVDLVTGWQARAGALAWVVTIGFFVTGLALYIAVIVAGVRDRRRLRAASLDPPDLLGRAGAAIRWSGLFAAVVAVLFFASCSAAVTPGADAHVINALASPGTFARQTVWLELPMLLAILLTPAFGAAAVATARSHPLRARRLAQLSVASLFILMVVSIATVIAGLVTGAATCGEFGPPDLGACGAAAASPTNLLSLTALALYVPCVGVITSALNRLHA
jgi:hypothetical protein